MDLSHPINVLAPGLTGAVLEVLARTTHPLTGRAVQQLASRSASQAGVQKALDRLAGTGLVRQTPAGRSILNQLNRDHALAPAVIEVVALGDDLPERVADVVRRHASGVSKALLFGSVTRGEAGPDSDVDLVLVWPADTDESARWGTSTDIAVRVTRFTGNPCIPLVYTESEYADLPRRAPAFAKSLARDGIDLLECGE